MIQVSGSGAGRVLFLGPTDSNSATGSVHFIISSSEQTGILSGSSTTTGSFGSYGNHFIPTEDNVKDMGSPTNRFRTVYAAETQVGGTFETGLRTKGIDKFETGTVVVWSKEGLAPCAKTYDNLVMGVIKKGRDAPIILGAEPVLLTGKVKLGDYIVTSKKSGHGMAISEKIFFNKNLFGKVIGQALEDAEGESVCVKCMIRKM